MARHYTAEVTFTDSDGYASVEEIDVTGDTWEEAKEAAEKILLTDYEPGGVLTALRPPTMTMLSW
jgi:hypothetical protein